MLHHCGINSTSTADTEDTTMVLVCRPVLLGLLLITVFILSHCYNIKYGTDNFISYQVGGGNCFAVNNLQYIPVPKL